MGVYTGSIDIIAGTGQIIGTDVWATVDEQLHDHSPELGEGLRDLVRAKTPVDSGSLLSDITYEAYPDPGGAGMESDLVWVYAETIQQEAYWNRVYVQYQEGGVLGQSTYTNAPHEMFFSTASTDGLEMAAEWATTWVDYADLLCVSGAGVPLP